MYKIYCDDICIYDPSGNIYVQVQNPKLIIERGKAGSLSFIIPPINVGYDSCEVFRSTIMVYSNDKPYWSGRIISATEDINKCKAVECEGALNFLKDIIQPQRTIMYNQPGEDGLPIENPSAYVTKVIMDYYNSLVPDKRKFKIGTMLIYAGGQGWLLAMEPTYDTVVLYNPDLYIRYEEDGMYLDRTPPMGETQQVIEFGKNLLDYSSTYDATDIVTAIIPKGAKIEEESTWRDVFVTVESVNDGKIYVENSNLVELYGRVEKIVEWPNITEPENLYEYAVSYLSKYQYDGLVLEVSVFDLHFVDPEIPSIQVGEKVRCISVPHGMDRTFPVTKIELPLDDPSGMQITLNKERTKSLSSQASDVSDKADELEDGLDEKIDEKVEEKTEDIVDQKINEHGYDDELEYLKRYRDGTLKFGDYKKNELLLENEVVSTYGYDSRTGYIDSGGKNRDVGYTALPGPRVGGRNGIYISTPNIYISKRYLDSLGVPYKNGQISNTFFSRAATKTIQIGDSNLKFINGLLIDDDRSDNIDDHLIYNVDYLSPTVLNFPIKTPETSNYSGNIFATPNPSSLGRSVQYKYHMLTQESELLGVQNIPIITPFTSILYGKNPLWIVGVYKNSESEWTCSKVSSNSLQLEYNTLQNALYQYPDDTMEYTGTWKTTHPKYHSNIQTPILSSMINSLIADAIPDDFLTRGSSSWPVPANDIRYAPSTNRWIGPAIKNSNAAPYYGLGGASPYWGVVYSSCRGEASYGMVEIIKQFGGYNLESLDYQTVQNTWYAENGNLYIIDYRYWVAEDGTKYAMRPKWIKPTEEFLCVEKDISNPKLYVFLTENDANDFIHRLTNESYEKQETFEKTFQHKMIYWHNPLNLYVSCNTASTEKNGVYPIL